MPEVLPQKENSSFEQLLKRHQELTDEWRRAVIDVQQDHKQRGDFDADNARAQRLIKLASELRKTEAELIDAAGQ